MVVVPPLTQCPEGNCPIVATGVWRLGPVGPSAPNVSQTVDREGGVPKQHRTPEKAHHQTTPTSDQKASSAERPGANPVVFVDPDQLWIGIEGPDVVQIGGLVLVAQDPAEVTPPETLARAMDIKLGIAVAVVLTMVRCPPQGTFLGRCSAAESHHELPETVQAVASMRKVAMVARGDEKCPRPVEHHAQDDRPSAHTGKDRCQAQYVHQPEWNRASDIDAFALIAN